MKSLAWVSLLLVVPAFAGSNPYDDVGKNAQKNIELIGKAANAKHMQDLQKEVDELRDNQTKIMGVNLEITKQFVELKAKVAVLEGSVPMGIN